MDEIKIKSVSDFIKHTESIPKKNSWLYRGQKSLEYKLIPNVGRKQFTRHGSLQSNEIKILEQFKESVHYHLDHIPKDDWEWLAIAQHYGLPTRLLDWSYNPLVALFFAVEEYFEDDSSVTAISVSEEVDREKDSPYTIGKVKRFTPPIISQRIRGQSGCFTIHPTPKKEYKPKKGFKYIIPFDSRRKIKQMLFKLGVRQRTIYPGLVGIAKDLTWLRTDEY